MSIEITKNRKRLLLIGCAASGWMLAFFVTFYLLNFKKGNDIQSFEEGIRKFSADLSDEIYKKIGSKTVAFVDFTDFQDKTTSFSSYVAQSVLSYIVDNNKNIIIVDRRSTRKTSNEMKLQSTGLIDHTQVVPLGRIAGAEYLLIGKAEYAGGYISTTAQLVDISTNIVNISKATYTRSNDIAYKLSGEEDKDQKVLFLLFSKIYDLIKNNYQWFWTAIVIPMIGWLVKLRMDRNIKNSEEMMK